jgi:hypothetical protein
VGVAATFEQAMATISARTGVVGDDLERVRQLALQMGADTAFSAQDAADAMLELMASGQSLEEAMQTLPAVQSILTLGLAIQLLFAVVGMRLFSGTFGSCTNPSLTTKALCDAAAAAADA